jgi:hypothetical protein
VLVNAPFCPCNHFAVEIGVDNLEKVAIRLFAHAFDVLLRLLLEILRRGWSRSQIRSDSTLERFILYADEVGEVFLSDALQFKWHFGCGSDVVFLALDP